ncbi:MAG: TraR/DksA family transcriptional regulator [Acidobacteria bacterium]|nr:MAG: TraR/DksA family transcriptional regulator [Acidobacteriota bacterium]REK10138.1 MAG: TraR/DksA family transcriptional regulator [Acidobacteriota bacterium]
MDEASGSGASSTNGAGARPRLLISSRRQGLADTKQTPPTSLPAKLATQFREQLEAKRDELRELYQQDVELGLRPSDGGMEDEVDRANNAYSRELTFAISDGERALLDQIEAALVRFERGTFGRCTSCGIQISRERLSALPWARHCMSCQELEERGQLPDHD